MVFGEPHAHSSTGLVNYYALTGPKAKPESGTMQIVRKGTIMFYLITANDIAVGRECQKSVSKKSEAILESVGIEVTPTHGAEKAHATRNKALVKMRQKTTPVGLLFAWILERKGRPLDYYLNRRARKMFSKRFSDLNETKKDIMELSPIRP
ncbi:hypothetical protein VTN77DRAFT_7752 [Rasamsonia byssochlamydoides]|uniref:uncharacterized protein n=1 Tax=Rasamsonia byssochlamydoides TaxID=89139 RepID=UPI0037434264